MGRVDRLPAMVALPTNFTGAQQILHRTDTAASCLAAYSTDKLTPLKIAVERQSHV
jgi:hypothetical protein